MQVNIEKLSPVVVEFHVQVPAERVKTEVDKAYGQLQRTARVRGFRQGKAPRHVLAHLYGGRVHADVAQRLVDDTLQRALAEKEVQPLNKPSIAPDELKPETDFSYKARFEVRPEIESVKWEGFSVRRPKVEVTGDMVDTQVESLRKQNSTLQPPEKERAAKTGDVVSLTFTVSVDGEEHSPGEQNIDTEVGSGEIFPELDEALAGMSTGDSKDVVISFPQSHPNPGFRGKEGKFKLILKEVKERILPDLDDEFAKDCGEYADLKALRKSVFDDIEKALKQRATDAVAEQLVVELCKANPIPVPPSLVEQQSTVTQRELAAQARRRGQPFNPNDELRARVRTDSEVKVRAGLLMAEIAKTKEVKVDETDLEKGYAELAEQTGKNVAKLKAEYRDPRKREMLVAMILEDKILDIIEGASKIVEGDAPAAEDAAGEEPIAADKKKAAKKTAEKKKAAKKDG